MVFLVGPRQRGKTTLAEQILAKSGGAYFNYDVDEHRRALRTGVLRFALGLRIGAEAKAHVVEAPIGGTPIHVLPASQLLAALV